MDILVDIVTYILGFGAAVFVPLIMLIVGLCVKMKFSDAFIAALTLGVAFTGMNVIINFMTGAITPAAQGLAEATGIQLTTVDIGWPALSAISWAWVIGILVFPLQIGINILMLVTKTTDTMNVDLWNVWNKIFTAAVVSYICQAAGQPYAQALAFGFIAAAIEVVIELKIGDVFAPTVEKITGIPGVTVPHPMAITAAIMYPIELLLEKIPALEQNALDAKWLRSKIGIFGENSVMGFIIGIILGAVAYKDVQKALTLGIEAGTAMQLFPMVSKLFMQALSPISDAVGAFMKKRFEGREVHIGLDWPIVAGSNELWVFMILMIPVELIYAIVLAPAGNTVLPFAGIINLCLGVSVLFIANGNLVKMLILGLIYEPIYLFVSSSFAPFVTEMARQYSPASLKGIDAGALISHSSLETPELRWGLAQAFTGNVWGFVVLAIVAVGLFFLFKGYKKKNDEINRELHAERFQTAAE